MKKLVLGLKHTAENILANSVATKGRPLNFKITVVGMCVADIIVMVYCMIKLMK